MPGRNTTITAVRDLRVGHWTDAGALTGCTVFVCDVPMVCGVDVRGSATGTREIEVCRVPHVADHVHGLLLAGGSAFGLDAAGGVMREMERDGRGFLTGGGTVPLVPTAILYDLAIGDGGVRPDAAAGAAAYHAATDRPVARGNVGAGAGATVGKLFGPARMMKGGLGSAALRLADVDVAVGALVAVNAAGDIRDPNTGRLIAGLRRESGRGLADTAKVLRTRPLPEPGFGKSTVIGCVATDARLTKEEATLLARAGSTALARCVSPAHMPVDGDVIFGLGHRDGDRRAPLAQLLATATAVMERAILDGVRRARPAGGLPAATRRA